MTGSLIYSNASIYEAVMRVLCGRGYTERLRSAPELIAEGSSVLGICCGPGTLFHRYLKTKGVHYTGLHINRIFVERLAAGGRHRPHMATPSWDMTCFE
jgi:imidazoleglycerol phosphate synthase glutamine amidotransferase subunit HisH